MYRKWQGILVSRPLSMTADKMLVDKINHGRRGTSRTLSLPPLPHNNQKINVLEKEIWELCPPYDKAFGGLLIESLMID